ncbi:hypothetical protein H072_6356 [Dactylellina haptotyla CBS 200.50]|uniref:DJ-1/PfpI domain-containing protein n=1 Tax=Dactylellina haptotyla (strain CBS 200.50) TaxID=1284197 RepID=S8BKC9_DACHA|nr:hypothetical protein H072_6356 [Dactylellina haptotyla CBS 200.50]
MKIPILTIAFCAVLAAATNSTGQPGPKPRNIGIVVWKFWEPMDVYGPIEVVTTIGFTQPINLYLLSADGQPQSTQPYFLFPEKANISTVILTDATFANPPPLDVVIIGGGGGTRNETTMAPVIEFAKNIYPSLQYIISVCTGATVLARAGLLDGKRATTNKKAWAWATTFGNRVRWQPHSRYVRDQNVWTTSGVSAGVDGMLGWVEYVWGSTLASQIEANMEWTRLGANGDKWGDYYGL